MITKPEIIYTINTFYRCENVIHCEGEYLILTHETYKSYILETIPISIFTSLLIPKCSKCNHKMRFVDIDVRKIRSY